MESLNKTKEELLAEVATLRAEVKRLQEHVQAEATLRFLSKANNIITSSLNYEMTIQNLANLLVPELADWCIIDLLQSGDTIKRVSAVASDPLKQKTLDELHYRFPPARDSLQPASVVLRTKSPLLFPLFYGDMYRETTVSVEHLRLLQHLAPHSVIAVPMINQDRLIGAITVAYAESNRSYDENDLNLVSELAMRAALAIDNANLYLEVEGQKKRLAVTLASIGDGVITTNLDGKVTFMNEMAQNLTGWSLADAENKDIDLVFPLSKEEIEQSGQNAKRQTSELGSILPLNRHKILTDKEGRKYPIGHKGSPIYNEQGGVIGAVLTFRDVTLRREQERKLFEQAQTLEAINHIGQTLSAELDLEKLVQSVTDAATALTGAMFGAFFYNHTDERGESLLLYTISGVPREAFSKFSMPRNTRIFAPTFAGEGIVRIDDVNADPRYGHNDPYSGIPEGHLPVKSYLAVPVISRSGTVIGSLIFGHPDAGVFTSREETIATTIAAQTAIAMDNATLYQTAQQAITERDQVIGFHRSLEEQLTLIVEASTDLLGSLELKTVLSAIVDLAQKLIAADAYAVWRIQPESKNWRILTSLGLSETYQENFIIDYNDAIPSSLAFIEDVETSAIVAHRLALYRAENIRSLLVVPLHMHGITGGSLTFYYHQTHQFSLMEQRIATALANLAASALSSAELYETQSQLRNQAERAQERLAFLAQASNIMASSLDYETTLKSVAELTVPRLADWCTVDIPDDDGTLKSLALVHGGQEKIEAALELAHQYKPDFAKPNAVIKAFKTGEATFVSEVTDDILVAGAVDDTHLALLRQLNIYSVMFVPIKTRDQVLAILSLATGSSKRRYSAEDLTMVIELARRAATAMDNALLYKEAQQAIRTRDQFLSIASHELRTPITALLGATQLQLRRAQKEGNNKIEDTRGPTLIVEQARRLDRLTRSLLDLSRIQMGRFIIEYATIDLVEIVKRAIEEIKFAADQHVVEAVGLENPLYIEGDELRLGQVFYNLLQNAIKYSPNGGVITITLLSFAEYVQITIADQGMGIPTEAIPHLFNRFYRAQNVDSRKISGMGIGLYVVKEIITLHQGTIDIQSIENKGSTFTIRLPKRMQTTSQSTENDEPRIE